ncbi:MAG: head-tail connector protein [Holosporaceae bacterium]|nr:phage head-tail connector protein [Rhodospirillaceae bacterium]
MTQGLMLLTPPAVEPVGLNEAKAYLGVLDSAEDSLISNLITAARQAVEQYCGRVLISQSWRLTLDTWPQETIVNGGLRDDVGLLAAVGAVGGLVEIQLPKPPLQAVLAIRVYSAAGLAATIPASNFVVDGAATPGRVVMTSGASLPVIGQSARGLEIDFTAGYGATANDVPAVLRQAVLQAVKALYGRDGDQSLAAALRVASFFKVKRVA